ncbi:MAG: NADH-quinone oxidoreductase subunit C [Ignavibacteriaceae bacterium]|nr:NADH-quinone oxidoreductase subunit C [Ignavibacteriaceae bacterium]
MDFKEKVIQQLNSQFPEMKLETTDFRGDFCIKFSPDNLLMICEFLKNNDQLKFLLCEDITAIDWASRTNRFTMVYHLFSLKNKFRLRLKTDVDDSTTSIESVSSIWRTANWQEREVYDMYGINFLNHPDLRRMYMPEEFEYHPLRKEFPVMGIPGSLPLPKK